MNASNSDVEELIRLAKLGDREALGDLLERHRGYLRVMAQRHIFGKLAARLDASDVIQQTCLSVYGNFERFRGEKAAEFVAWLQKIHEQNIQNVVRDHTRAQKRAVGREQSLDDLQGGAGEFPRLGQTSASQRVFRGEQAAELARMLERLPDDQREAVRLRHLEGCSLAEMTEHMNRSEAATIGLLKRGMQNLRKFLGAGE